MLFSTTKTKINTKFNKLAIFKAPKSVILTLIFILSSSILCLYSSSGGQLNPWAIKQLSYIIIAACIFYCIISINTKFIFNISYICLLVSIILLLIVMFFGKKTLGASRWINFGFFTFQPSEFAKIAVILTLAKFFSTINAVKIKKISTTIFSFLIIAPVVMLVVIQPDLATSIIILSIYVVLLYCIGTSKLEFIFAGVTLIFSAPIIWLKFLKDYQKLRIINFLFPENDPLGSGYNVIQSKISIGSGGLFGKGFLEGTQGKLRFLPEHHTDFIFTNIGEEWGFIGSIVIIFAYIYIIFYGFYVSNKINSTFGKLVCIGCSTLLFLHMFINIGMTLSLMPVAGIPLLMMSYGGSGLILGVICIALIINIDINKELI